MTHPIRTNSHLPSLKDADRNGHVVILLEGEPSRLRAWGSIREGDRWHHSPLLAPRIQPEPPGFPHASLKRGWIARYQGTGWHSPGPVLMVSCPVGKTPQPEIPPHYFIGTTTTPGLDSEHYWELIPPSADESIFTTLPTERGFYWWRCKNKPEWRIVHVEHPYPQADAENLRTTDIEHQSWRGRSIKDWRTYNPDPIGEWQKIKRPT
jgi:hypothetical protein